MRLIIYHWVSVQAKIDWSDPETLAKMKRIRKTVVKKLNARWRKHKHNLYVDYYLDNAGLPKRFVCADNDVNQQQWRTLVLHWDKFGEVKIYYKTIFQYKVEFYFLHYYND